jgi:hypothetical protein
MVDLMVRRRFYSAVSNHDARDLSSFETPRNSAAPQDEELVRTE